MDECAVRSLAVVWFARAQVNGHTYLGHLRLLADWAVKVDQAVKVFLFHVRQNPCRHTPINSSACVSVITQSWIKTHCGFVVCKSDADLADIVGAFQPVGCFPYLLDGRNQQTNQYGNDGDDNQQFDQRESAAHGYNPPTCFVSLEMSVAYEDLAKSNVHAANDHPSV